MRESKSFGSALPYWKLRLFGSFALYNPDGHCVRVADRKVEGLLAALALHRDHGIERRTVADILWPTKAPANLTNLRQALSVLRRILGESAIESSRQHCRLSSEIQLASDLEDGTKRDGIFMPGHEGEWFEQVRRESDLDDSNLLSAPASVVSSFYKTLEWFAVHDRSGMHALMSARNSLTRGFVYADLLHLLRSAPDDPGLIGWAAYWQGTAEDDLEACAQLLRTALREAKSSGDLALASEACLELGKVYSRTGKLDRALRICDIADGVAASSKSKAAAANALRLRGNVWMNWEDQTAGAVLLRKAEAKIEDPVELATSICSRAFLEASAGSFETASQTMEGSISLSKQLGHNRIGNVSALTKILLLLSEGKKDACSVELGKLADEYFAVGSTQFAVYAEELLAKLHYLEGNRAFAKQRLDSARKSRTSSQMVVTNLEAQRIKQLA